ncbi:D-alanyl-D-alanine carboxypeptidase family protein [Streptomyces sp. VRA16 Mangrove soil]|uniref:D-alanyl-D-alanine carboxypeptidase family protein n=1 Tax=Streptomyces sp. VRA16 Mangrove soil TaxID=2817434 RepID=UPI001A9EBCD9|nr:D-alanyl-D-alanine carboxypeptidase [Streptomyces sp. VRA16 Mangrove soil]MBO1333006.1 D-alanyl-D-alanine carboxypeptidase [Streptomyces sp. VRA16 Mangrove soil]
MATFIRFRPLISRAVVTSGVCATLAAGATVGPARAAQAVQDPPAAPSLSALSWEVMDARTGTVLAARAPHLRLPPASTLKTLFAVTLLPRLRQDTVHRATAADLAEVAEGSSEVGVEEGHRYTVADLWRGVFLSSGNDAVHTLAQMNGGLARTLAQMQATARRIGAVDTQVRSPDGFDTPGQFSSAHDLALIAREGFKNPDFRRYMGTKWARFPASGGPGAYEIQNTNRLLVGSHGVEPYPGLIGVKNGYTSQAGTTLVSAATRHGRTVLVTVMNPQDEDFNAVYEESRALLDWGFAAPMPRPARQQAGPQRSAPAAAPAPTRQQPEASPGLGRHLGAATALLVLTCVPFVVRRRMRARRAGR